MVHKLTSLGNDVITKKVLSGWIDKHMRDFKIVCPKKPLDLGHFWHKKDPELM